MNDNQNNSPVEKAADLAIDVTKKLILVSFAGAIFVAHHIPVNPAPNVIAYSRTSILFFAASVVFGFIFLLHGIYQTRKGQFDIFDNCASKLSLFQIIFTILGFIWAVVTWFKQ
jgi:hypothetical protein